MGRHIGLPIQICYGIFFSGTITGGGRMIVQPKVFPLFCGRMVVQPKVFPLEKSNHNKIIVKNLKKE